MAKLLIAAAAVFMLVPVSGLMQQVDQRDQKCQALRASGRLLPSSERANAEWNCGPIPGVTR